MLEMFLSFSSHRFQGIMMLQHAIDVIEVVVAAIQFYHGIGIGIRVSGIFTSHIMLLMMAMNIGHDNFHISNGLLVLLLSPVAVSTVPPSIWLLLLSSSFLSFGGLAAGASNLVANMFLDSTKAV
jgi:hypothetical protein